MSNIEKLIGKLNKAKELTEARQKRLDVVVKPILKEFKVKNADYIDSVEVWDSMLHIEYSWYCYGHKNTDSFNISMSVIRADDPVAAAKELIETRKQNDLIRKLAYEKTQLEALVKSIAAKESLLDKT